MATFPGSDTWHALIVGPDPGDTVTAASVVDGDTLLADRTKYLYERLDDVWAPVSNTFGYQGSDSTDLLQDVKASTSFIQVASVLIGGDIELGDQVRIRAMCHAYYEGASPAATEIRAHLQLNDSGPSYTITGTGEGRIARMRDRGVYAPGDPLYCEALYKADVAGLHRVGLFARVSAASVNAAIHGPWFLTWETIRQVRP